MSTVQEVLQVAQQALADAVKKHAHLNSKETKTSPAAPNTGSFIATRSSMVELRKDHAVYDGMFVRHYPVAAIIGSLHGLEIARDVFGAMLQAVKDVAEVDQYGNAEAIAQCEDGRVHLKYHYGTSYSTVGARSLAD